MIHMILDIIASVLLMSGLALTFLVHDKRPDLRATCWHGFAVLMLLMVIDQSRLIADEHRSTEASAPVVNYHHHDHSSEANAPFLAALNSDAVKEELRRRHADSRRN